MIKINLPEQKISQKDVESRIKRMFTEDFEKAEGLLSKCLVFVYLNGPLAVSDLQDLLLQYYKKEIDRVVVFRACDRLSKWGLIVKVTAGDLLSIPETEKETIHTHAEAKHRKFLTNISPQLRGRYNIRNYIWISDEGKGYLEWCCKLNGFEFKEDGR